MTPQKIMWTSRTWPSRVSCLWHSLTQSLPTIKLWGYYGPFLLGSQCTLTLSGHNKPISLCFSTVFKLPPFLPWPTHRPHTQHTLLVHPSNSLRGVKWAKTSVINKCQSSIFLSQLGRLSFCFTPPTLPLRQATNRHVTEHKYLKNTH